MEAYKPRRLRILDSGLGNYTGVFGTVEFENGVSVSHVEWKEAERLGALIHIEDADQEGYQINSAAEMTRSRELPADDARVRAFDRTFQTDGTMKLAIDHFTREELEEMADKGGLAAVRDLARQWGGTGRSINECINVVLHAQVEDMKAREANG